MDDLIKISSCPFCDSDNILIYENEANSPAFGKCLIWYCRCEFCGCQGPWCHKVGKDDVENSKFAIENWNRRDKIYDRA